MPIFVGIDPGVSGALAAIHPSGKVDIFDCPLLPKKGKWNSHDSATMYGILKGPYDAIALIEHVRFDSRDGSHKGSAEVLVRNHEAWLTILSIVGIPTLDLEVPAWRKAAGCKGLTDEVGIVSYALSLYPQMRSTLKRRSARAKSGYVYEHNRAEALLMAHACKTLSENAKPGSTTTDGILSTVNG